MSEVELRERWLAAGERGKEAEIRLRQWENPGEAVLLLHGASAQSGSFLVPEPALDGTPRSLAAWLHERGYDVWLLDWRGSCVVVDRARDRGLLARHPEVFDFDNAARYDLPLAVEAIRESRQRRGLSPQVAAVGHCMGGAVLCQAIATGSVAAPEPLRCVVLLTMGLFYRSTIAGEVKAKTGTLDHLERFAQAVEIDARVDLRGLCWPGPLEKVYDFSARAHPRQHPSPEEWICNRLSFMYGQPYLERQLVPEIHAPIVRVAFRGGRVVPQVGADLAGARSGRKANLTACDVIRGHWHDGTAEGEMTFSAESAFLPGEELHTEGLAVADAAASRAYPAQLCRQFGSIPLAMYAQGVENVLDGRAGLRRRKRSHSDESLFGAKSRERFRALEHVTLITGAENRLWRKTGLQVMHDWLTNDKPAVRCTRHVVPDFGHQDLFWGRQSVDRVFPLIRAGLC